MAKLNIAERRLPQDGRIKLRMMGKEIDLRVHLDLADAGQLDLDRVLDRDDVLVGGVDARERAVERRRLAAAGRARHEHDPVRPRDQLVHRGELLLVEAERGEVEQLLGARQEPHHDPLAVGHR